MQDYFLDRLKTGWRSRRSSSQEFGLVLFVQDCTHTHRGGVDDARRSGWQTTLSERRISRAHVGTDCRGPATRKRKPGSARSMPTGSVSQRTAARAFAYYLRSAEHGNPLAANNVGAMYAKGDGVARDPLAGASWFLRAAESGDALGQFNYAVTLTKGTGVETDVAQAVSWYRRATEAGHCPSQARLGYCYDKGLGLAVDPVEALVSLTLASRSWCRGGDQPSWKNSSGPCQPSKKPQPASGLPDGKTHQTPDGGGGLRPRLPSYILCTARRGRMKACGESPFVAARKMARTIEAGTSRSPESAC